MNIYVSIDGEEFYSESLCRTHEKNLAKKQARKEFLEEQIFDMMLKSDCLVEDWLLKKVSMTSSDYIRKNIWICALSDTFQMGYKDEEGNPGEEFDENCPFNLNEWYRIEEDVDTKYNYLIKDQYYYWPK